MSIASEQTRAEQLADALIAVAATDHYMVGIVEKVTLEEAREAEQILIEMQNSTPMNSRYWSELNAALDISENLIRGLLGQPARSTEGDSDEETEGGL